MLVLRREEGQVVHIGPDITVTITEIRGGSVGVGISAPPSVKIWRDEIAEKVGQQVESGLENAANVA